MHIILLGDSIFDNRSYVNPGEPDVITQLQAKLADDDTATLLAVDGNVIHGIAKQLKKLPDDTTHLVLSVGGNDVLGYMGDLQQPVAVAGEAMMKVATRMQAFEAQYRAMLSRLLTHKLPTTLCTMYNPRFDEAVFQQIAVTSLTAFNDVIIRVATEHRLPLIDLRLVCDEDADFANPIEPSMQGGDKITDAILQVLTQHDFTQPKTVIYG